MIVKLLTEQHLEFLSLKGGCRDSSKSTLVKMSNCWKSHNTGQLYEVSNIAALPNTYARSSKILRTNSNDGFTYVSK